jgi:ribonucleoside-diphosphate reductase alpha chain
MLPYDNGTYQQAPYQQIDSHAYELAVEEFPEVDWSVFPSYELEDTTTSSQELACTGGVCEIVGSAE